MSLGFRVELGLGLRTRGVMVARRWRLGFWDLGFGGLPSAPPSQKLTWKTKNGPRSLQQESMWVDMLV